MKHLKVIAVGGTVIMTTFSITVLIVKVIIGYTLFLWSLW